LTTTLKFTNPGVAAKIPFRRDANVASDVVVEPDWRLPRSIIPDAIFDPRLPPLDWNVLYAAHGITPYVGQEIKLASISGEIP
jgi:hypothetical protein